MTKKEAIDHFGTATALAKALGITLEAVSQWRDVPMRRQYEIERITKGGVKADEV
jgi:DNA-binding transcriptional regulator YdaS (Cro superfamily)